MSERDWSADWNALPHPIRIIGAALECKLRVQHLEMEKARAKKAYERICQDCNRHIDNCRQSLKRLETEAELIAAMETPSEAPEGSNPNTGQTDDV